jgi:hypothetical protein
MVTDEEWMKMSDEECKKKWFEEHVGHFKDGTSMISTKLKECCHELDYAWHWFTHDEKKEGWKAARENVSNIWRQTIRIQSLLEEITGIKLLDIAEEDYSTPEKRAGYFTGVLEKLSRLWEEPLGPPVKKIYQEKEKEKEKKKKKKLLYKKNGNEIR